MSTPELTAAREQMLRTQLKRRGIHDRAVLEVMARVPRERFVGAELCDQAYADRALPIDCSQTISQPYIVALMTQALELTGRETVLEIGTGSGYQTAVLAELAGRVITVERHANLSEQATARLSELGYRNVTPIVDDGTLGREEESPYDRIIVTAAAAESPPALFEQLRDGGILVIPLGGHEQQVLRAIRKMGSLTRETDLSLCRFVPLIGAGGWSEQ